MGSKKSDEELLSAFIQGRRTALGELAQRHELSLLGLACGLLGGRTDLAGDAVQETWVRVIRFGDRFNGRSSFKTWLYRIAINQCRNIASAMSSDQFSGSDLSPETAAYGKTPAHQTAPEEAAQTEERHAVLRRAVERLGPDKSIVLLLCYHEGLTHQEAAEILEIPVGTLKSRLNAALNELRDRLSSEMTT